MSDRAHSAESRAHLVSMGRVDEESVVSFPTARHMVLIAGDLEPATLMQLADAIAGPLYDQLAGA